jgi:hypothetical protein
MPHMIELIRASAVPANIVQSAAKGALALPATEMVEILVYLASHNDVFGEQARMTLAGWNEKSLRAIAADPQTPPTVLEYLTHPKNLRSPLLPALLENPAVPDTTIVQLAAAASRENVELILASARALRSHLVLKALEVNPNSNGSQAAQIKEALAALEPRHLESHEPEAEPEADGEVVLTEMPPPASEEPSAPGEAEEADKDVAAYFAEHSEEIAAAQDKMFQPASAAHDEILTSEEPLAEAAAAGQSASGSASKRTSPTKKAFLSADEQRGSALQKISRLDVKGRIQLAMKGSKEERSILVRDGTKVVALAVLDSPKVTDGEVEMFASQKNVLEALLRGISMKRRFVKNYAIVRNLCSNPRTPLDISLSLIKNLLVNDLKNLSANKDVSDTIRKLALKMYRQKKDPTRKSSG